MEHRLSLAHRLVLALAFAGYFFIEMVKANLRVAYDVVTPTHYMHPGIVAMELRARTDLEITVLANLVTLTPGTLSLDVSADRRYLYIHTMYLSNLRGFRKFEERLLRVMR